MRKKAYKEIELNQFQMNVLLNEEEKEAYRHIVNHATFCVHCHEMCSQGVEVKENFLNEHNDILFRGLCKKCGGRVARFIEYGEFEEFWERAIRFRKSIGAE